MAAATKALAAAAAAAAAASSSATAARRSARLVVAARQVQFSARLLSTRPQIFSAPPAAAAAAACGAFSRVQARAFSGGVVTQAVKDFGAESIKEGTLIEFRKKPGDSVEKGEVVASIETDKVTVEVNAEESGVIKELLAKPDDNVSKGQALFSIEVGAAPSAAASSASAPAAAAASPAPAASSGGAGRIIEQGIKDFGAESITEGTLMEWRKKVGESVEKGEVIAVIETDKVSVELNAEESGVVRELLAKADDTIKAGQPLVKIEAGAAAAGGASQPAAVAAAASPAAAAAAGGAAHGTEGLTGIRLGFAIAAARRAGTPLPGEAAPSSAKPAASAPAAAPARVLPPTTSVGEGRTERKVPLSSVRRAVVQRLKESQNTLALITTFQEADLTDAIAAREKYKDIFKKAHNADLGLLSIIVKACASGLMDIPGVNGVIDDGAGEIVYRDYVDISVPIPSPRGPVSCVVRNAESMTIRDIEQCIAGLMDRARRDRLTPDDLASATFGIADNGSSGGMLGTNFINPPASATLGTNAVSKRAAVVGGKVAARQMMYLSLTYDHRLVDGREAATFLGSVRDKLEDPVRLLLDV